MLNKIKHIIKQIITFLHHPFMSVYMFSKGNKRFYIGSRLYLNKFKYLEFGNNFYLGNDCRILFVENYGGKNYKPSLKIGHNCTMENRFTALCADSIEIQENCLIASDVFITTENHGINPEISENYANQPLTTKPVVIEKGCWLGEKVCILPGVRLGERSIVATGAVVTKSFPSFCLVGGVPAKLLKRYNQQTHKWEKVS